ncbi:Flp1 family type IVb pilin [Candidatus Merdisoma sp. HCP28S3_D10]|mgnify:FL=1|uniref:Flp1 family type IVb pilin n=1 Tax=unclassified Candidatus Merdisoma TaxID=3099611 RepID=UPI003F8B340A
MKLLRRWNRLWKKLWRDEEGIGTVEMILILVVLIALVLIFKSKLTSLVNEIFDKITSQSRLV